jgi:hypothetical protein
MVLLHTDDVPADWLEKCRHVGWHTVKIEHIPYDRKLYEKGRFQNVFTKLQVMGLDQYDKVVLMDTDMLVRDDKIDNIFQMETPCAIRRHAAGRQNDGDKLDFNDIWGEDLKTIGGINAGFVLLKPNKEVLAKMKYQLNHVRRIPGKAPLLRGPEQDYLSRFYSATGWNLLGVQWNYQLHQLSYCSRKGHANARRMKLPYKDIKVLHFSGRASITDKILRADRCEETLSEYVTKTVNDSYVKLLEADEDCESDDTRGHVRDHIKLISCQAMNEWFIACGQFEKDNPDILALIMSARESHA